MKPPLTLFRGARLVTLADAARDNAWGLIDDGALLVDGEWLSWVGPIAQLPAASRPHAEVDLGGALVTPGLIDAHTHLVYAGERAGEFEQRLLGMTYADIANAGGGIRSTVAATRQASDERLFALSAARARALMAEGVTTLEIKSGYGLSEAHEARCLAVARRIGRELPVCVRTTSLAAHALPPEFEGRPDDYVDAVCAWLTAQAQQGLVDAVDAFCDTIGFSPAQVTRVFEAARALGLPVKLHAEQLSNQEGAALGARYGALSCDHLEHLSSAGIDAMRAAGTVALLLPFAYYFLRDSQPPPIARLREAGVPMAIATDHNPGSSPVLSLLLVLNMACTLFQLTPQEALRGVTVHAARALGLHDRGQLLAGQRADFVAWDLEHPRELAYRVGPSPCLRSVFAGRERT